MKKIIKTIVIVLASVLAMLLVWNLTDCATLHNKDTATQCSLTESWRLGMLLGMKRYAFTGYSCPFYEDYSIQMGGLTYCIAEDDCEAIYIPGLNLYHTISPSHKAMLRKMLDVYW